MSDSDLNANRNIYPDAVTRGVELWGSGGLSLPRYFFPILGELESPYLFQTNTDSEQKMITLRDSRSCF